MSTLYPTEDRLLIKTIKAEETTRGGIIVPASAQEIPNRGIVVEAGPGRMDVDGNLLPMWIKKDMVVQWSKFGGGEPFTDEDGQAYTWMRQSDILCVVGA